MKVRIIKTGEIVNVSYLTSLEYCNSNGYPINIKPEEVELIQKLTKDEHWQDVRERAAIAAMQGLLCAPSYKADRSKLNMIAGDAISIADTLIEKLKEK